MNFLVLFTSVCLIACASADEGEINTKRNAASDKCKTDLKLDDGVVDILKTKKIPETESERCFLECIYNELGLVKNDKLDAEGAAALAKHRFGDDKASLDKADTVFKTCNDEITSAKSTEKCAMGKLLRSCFLTHGQNIQIFPKTA